MSELKELSIDSIQKGSKTFSLAAKFFSREKLEAAAQIYSWCRYCDDLIDQEHSTFINYDLLVKGTFQGSDEFQFQVFSDVCRKYSIPLMYPEELLAGMKMDLDNTEYKSYKDLELYAYRVAGTVGLMMSHVMGIYDEKALKQAAELGMAMQLTNIARDIKEDYLRGRVYLPQDWLAEEGLNKQTLLENKQQLKKVVARLLRKADELYVEGGKGISHLPLRSALTVTIAKNLYREIGKQVMKQDERFAEDRAVVSIYLKLWLIVLSALEILRTLPQRMLKGGSPVTITTTWRLHE